MHRARKTRKQLESEISELREELSREKEKTRRSAFIDDAKLPKCKSLACADCKHVVVRRTCNGGLFVLGCGKHNPCGEYEKDLYKCYTAPAIQSALQSQWQL